jgi:hypothetical protein
LNNDVEISDPRTYEKAGKRKIKNRIGAQLNSSNREKSKEQFEQWQQSQACSVTFGNKTYSSY